MAVATVITSRAEAEGLIRWSMLFALAKEEERLVVFYAAAVKNEFIESAIQHWKADQPSVEKIDLIQVEDDFSAETVVANLDEASCGLVVLGHNRESEKRDETLQVSRKIFDQAHCDTIMIRLGSRKVTESDTVLVPTAGGPHSRIALRLASQVAKRFAGTITPLYIEPNIGQEDGKAVGMRILNRVLGEAGVDKDDTDHVRPKVIMADKPANGLRKAVEEDAYDLVMIGASNSLSVRRKLFGAFPDKLLRGDEALTLAVVRKRRPMTHRIRHRFERFLSLRVPQLEREERISLFERLQTNSVWSFDFMMLILLSTGIASFGLIQNSAAVVIGAMLVAPLMTPLLGGGLALVQGNLPLMRTCLKSIFLGFFAALAIGTAIGFLAPISTLTNELAARGGPNLLDLGVAALSGVAASYCVARPNLSSALAGVAIAAALVPPIATVGISLALGEWINARGAAMLFGTNVVAIILASALNFFAAGIRAQSGTTKNLWVARTLICLFALIALMAVPLTTVLVSSTAETIEPGWQHREKIEAVMLRTLEESDNPAAKLSLAEIERGDEATTFVYALTANKPPSKETVSTVARALEKELNFKKVKVRVETILQIESD